MTFSHPVFVHFLFLRCSTFLQVLIFFPCMFMQFLFISHGLPRRFSMTSSTSSLPLPASRSCLSIHIAASLLTGFGAGTCWCSRSSSPALVLQGAQAGLVAPRQGRGGLCCPACLLAARAGPRAPCRSTGAESSRKEDSGGALAVIVFLLHWERAPK